MAPWSGSPVSLLKKKVCQVEKSGRITLARAVRIWAWAISLY
nr:hypothetical protein [Enterocloster clostridioformis]